VHQALFGVYLGMTFAPNHKGMPHPTGDEDYLRKQVLTSRNVRGNWLTDAAMGGLNYQIEHHLFPDLPAHRYPQIAPEVRALCEKHDLPYNTGGLLRQIGSVWSKIFRLGLPNFFTKPSDEPGVIVTRRHAAAA
jgi:fatty acid desaturase